MKRLIYSILAFAVIAMANACDKNGSEPDVPKLYVNTWVVNFSSEFSSIIQLNDDGTVLLGNVFTKETLAELKESIDMDKLTEAQKSLVNGIKVNDVYSFNGWYSMKMNSDGSMAFCLTYENLSEDGPKTIPMAFYVKEVTGDHMLLFNGDYDEKDNPKYMKAVSLEKSSVSPGTYYDQRLISELPHIENVDAEVQ